MNKYILFADGKSPHTLKWVKELVKYFDIYLISLNGVSKDIEQILPNSKIFVLNSSVKSSGGNFSLALKYFDLLKLIDEIKPKYFNAHYLSSYGFLAALVKRKRAKIKLIQSTWGTDVLVTPKENLLKKYIAKFALKMADLVTSDSYFMSDEIEKIYPKVKIDTFPFGLESFEKEKIIKDDRLIFSNRALSENYNIDKIIKWFAILDSRYKLVIANSGDMEDSLHNLVKELNIENRVEFVGFLNAKEQAKYYKKAKYYISIPSSDSTAVSLLEAMRYGCLPIVSNLASNREWIIDECNGLFFNEELNIAKIEKDIIQINQEIILKKAIFENSIKDFVRKVNSL